MCFNCGLNGTVSSIQLWRRHVLTHPGRNTRRRRRRRLQRNAERSERARWTIDRDEEDFETAASSSPNTPISCRKAADSSADAGQLKIRRHAGLSGSACANDLLRILSHLLKKSVSMRRAARMACRCGDAKVKAVCVNTPTHTKKR